MMRLPHLSARISGAFRPLIFAILCITLSVQGCIYGFKGGGLPSHIKTVAVIPFENQTATPELQREITEQLRIKLRDRLGLREASEGKASAIVRGSVKRYEIDIPIGYSADRRSSTTARRMLQLVVDIEMVDQTNGKTLWARKGVAAEGQYEERGEPAARLNAIDRIVNTLVEGAQSQW